MMDHNYLTHLDIFGPSLPRSSVSDILTAVPFASFGLSLQTDTSSKAVHRFNDNKSIGAG